MPLAIARADQGLLYSPAPAQGDLLGTLPGFSVKPWGLLHFDPVEYPVTKEELAGFQKAAMQGGVSFCFLSTWEQRHEDKDLLEMFK
jgi:hypothetical protein